MEGNPMPDNWLPVPENYLIVGGNAYALDTDGDLIGAPVNTDGSIDWDMVGLVGEPFNPETAVLRNALAATIAAADALAALY
jgi:hypothetical protein